MSPASLVLPRLGLPRGIRLRRKASVALVVFAVVLLLRRSAGAFVVPLTPSAALACGSVLGGIAAAIGCGRFRSTPLCVLNGVAMLTACAALSLPGMTPSAAASLWLPAIGGLAIVLGSRRRTPLKRSESSQPVAVDDAVLTLVRRTTTEFDECRGTARAVFTAGQKSAAIHLSFCPPFAGLPTAEVAVVDATDASVRPQQLYPYAARLEVRPNSTTTAPREIVVRFRFVVPTSSAHST